MSKGQTYLRGLGQRLRGEEKHAGLECCRNTAVCIKEGMSISTYTHYSMFQDSEWHRLSMLRLGRLLKLGAISFVCLVARIGSFRSPYRGKILLEPALRIDMCNGASLSDKLAHDRYIHYIWEWNLETPYDVNKTRAMSWSLVPCFLARRLHN